MARQQSALTNLLGQMRAVTEQAESTEPLLSQQLYDILRRTDQMHTDSQLDMSARLVDRGFLPQAGEAEKSVRQNLDDIRQSVDRAAESVLGSETDALKYAQKELDDLTGQLGKDLAVRTNASPGSAGQKPAPGQGSPNQSPGQAQGNSPSMTGEQLRQFAQQLGASGGAGGLGDNGPITGNNFVDWSERVRDVEQAVDSPDVRNQLATARERVGAYRRAYRETGRLPSPEELQNKALAPLALARDWVGQELSRAQNNRSLVPLDRDPAPDKYSDLLRKYYEKLGSPQ
jgi:hypothetical protein